MSFMTVTAPPQKNFLPDFCALKMLLAVFFLTELVAFLLTLAANSNTGGFFADFFLRSLFVLWIALLSMALLCGLRKFAQHLSNSVAGGLAFLLIQLITLFISGLTVTLLPNISLLFPELTGAEKWNFCLRTLGMSSLLSLAFLRYVYVLCQWQQYIEATATAKLYALQARMQPHFLFNSLNSIASLTRINPALAEVVVEDLAQLMRASMNVDEKLLVPLAEELNLVKLYLAVEKQRLEERLQVHWQLDDVPENALLPPLSLQPLVENAVYYGVEPNPSGGKIVISGEFKNNKLLITIVNSYQPDGVRQRQGNHIALTNLAARLNGCFAEAAVLRIEKTVNYYQVSLTIPYQT
jgi:two-component system sensor histidine kinase AlgZ